MQRECAKQGQPRKLQEGAVRGKVRGQGRNDMLRQLTWGLQAFRRCQGGYPGHGPASRRLPGGALDRGYGSGGEVKLKGLQKGR